MRRVPATHLAALFVEQSARLLGEVSADVTMLAGPGGPAREGLDRLRNAVHSIAGSAAVLGLEAITVVARELERELTALLRTTGERVPKEARKRLDVGFRELADACAAQAVSRLSAAAVTPAGGARAPAPDGGPLVVQIEDNPVNALLVERVLELRPHVRLATFAQGRAGIEAIFAERPALVVLDLNLPDIPGEEVLRLLRADERTRSLPIVVLSGDIVADRRRAVLEVGADAFLGKPFDVQELLSLVDQACGPAPGD